MNDERMDSRPDRPDQQEVRLRFEPGKGGSVGIRAVTALCGDRVGALPSPTRRGYRFRGWYTKPVGEAGGREIRSSTVLETDSPAELTLYAHWEKEKGGHSALRVQKRAIVALIVAVALLVGGLLVTNYIVSIYRYEDYDGVTYLIKKKSGEYGLYDKSGSRCGMNDDGYYLTAMGTQLSIDKESGDYTIYAVVDTDGTEMVGTSQRVLAFKQLTYDNSSSMAEKDPSCVIKSIEIHNQYGVIDLYRPENVDTNYFVIRGHEGTSLSNELFAQLAVGCGYTISMQRLEDPVRLENGDIDYAEYGLAAEQRVKTDENGDPVLDEDGQEVMYDYTPTWYTIKTMEPDAATGLDSYTMILGDAIVSEAGYYARYEGRDTIYILSSTNLDAAVLQPIETLVTPMVVYPMSVNSYFNVKNFILRTDILHDRLMLYMAAERAGLLKDGGLEPDDLDDTGSLPEETLLALKAALEELDRLLDDEGKNEAQQEKDEAAWMELYAHAMDACSRTVTAFSYVDMSDRQNTLLSSYPYKMATNYMSGYRPNADNISSMLQSLYSMSMNSVKVLGPNEDQLEEYGLSEYRYDISYTYIDEDGAEHESHVMFSERTEEGLYYAYSDIYDMIVELDESQAPFLAWKDIDWYDRSYFQYNIGHIQQLKFEGTAVRELGEKYLNADGSVILTFDNSASEQSKENVNSDKLVVWINGEATTYAMDIVRVTGRVETMTGTQNVRYFVQSLLTASIEGEAELTEEEMADLRESDPDDSECYLKVTAILDDGRGKNDGKANLVYRFYRTSERKCYMTVESLLNASDQSDPADGQGRFYVLRSFCEKLAADLKRLQDREQVYPDSKN